jgi:hypothetical protein
MEESGPDRAGHRLIDDEYRGGRRWCAYVQAMDRLSGPLAPCFRPPPARDWPAARARMAGVPSHLDLCPSRPHHSRQQLPLQHPALPAHKRHASSIVPRIYPGPRSGLDSEIPPPTHYHSRIVIRIRPGPRNARRLVGR